MKKLSVFLVALTMLLVSCKPEIEKPTVVTKSVGEVTETTAKVVGQVIADGGAEVSERGVCWNTEGAPAIIDFRTKDGSGVGSFTSSILDLVPNTKYYVRAYATNEVGTSYGEEKTFTTLEVIPEEPVGPVVITSEVTEITVNSAVCGGEVISSSGSVVVARGVCWNTSGQPTVSDTYTMDGTNVGSFTSQIPNLVPNTQYYVRAYATNAKGVTAYGEEVSFTTLEKLLPIVITAEVTDITLSSATCGGEVAFEGNVAVTARGICWSTSQKPTIEDNKTTEGSGVGSFTSQIQNLVSNTQYYIRAYATNEVGTVYGEEVSFTTLERNANGREYVDLGLSVKWATCNVGATSPEEYGDYFAWGEITTKAEYNSSNCPTYGLSTSQLQEQGYIDGEGNLTPQYDAATVNWDGGWRMPTKSEQEELLDNCTWTWTTQNGVNGYNVTGPNGNSIFLPAAGYRFKPSLNNAGGNGYYWSSTHYDYYICDYAFRIDFDSVDRFVYEYGRYYGQSVRPVIE